MVSTASKRQFYDCKSGGSTESSITYCKLEANSRYYAVIVVPTLAFGGFLIAMYLFKYRSLFFGSGPAYTNPEKITPETTHTDA